MIIKIPGIFLVASQIFIPAVVRTSTLLLDIIVNGGIFLEVIGLQKVSKVILANMLSIFRMFFHDAVDFIV